MLSNKLKYIIFFIILILIFIVVFLFTTYLTNKSPTSGFKGEPVIKIIYPKDEMSVFNLVIINGTASDDMHELVDVEIKIDNDLWRKANGTYNWSFNWNTYEISDGLYEVQVRAWDGESYSNIEKLKLYVNNPDEIIYGQHKWALFIAADNFPDDNESKLGNGGLYIAENISSYLIENCSYPTSNVVILFDDGWIRSDNGYGNPIQTLQQKSHKFRIDYGSATKENVAVTIDHLVEQSNKYDDSEVFIWLFGHGYGTESRFAGEKFLKEVLYFYGMIFLKIKI